MATEPWKRPWEQHQSSRSAIDASANQILPEDSRSQLTSTAGSPAVLRRLPPLHATHDAPAEPTQPPASRRASVNSISFIATSPNLAWQYEASASSKRRRLLGADANNSLPPNAYSAQSLRGGELAQSISGHLPADKDGSHGSHATRAFPAAQTAEVVERLRDSHGTTASLSDCCPVLCNGKACTTLRAVVSEVTTEFSDLDQRLQGAFAGASAAPSPHQLPDVEQVGLLTTLEWLLDRLRVDNAGIRSLLNTNDTVSQETRERAHGGDPPPPPLSAGVETEFVSHAHPVGSGEDMKRQRSQSTRENQAPRRIAPSLPAPTPGGGPAGSTSLGQGPFQSTSPYQPTAPEPSRNTAHVVPGESQPVSRSPHRTTSSTGSAFNMPQQSPVQASQQHAAQPNRLLPSPSRMQFPPSHQAQGPIPGAALGGPSSSSHPSPQSSSPAHLQHLQELQHQISVKTLAHQTLEGEYKALLAKLERQQTKCFTLENKFKVSDVEINSLTDERERLQSQLQILEVHAEELTRGRDDARREMAESSRQYVRIVEMANRLQAQGADERRKWEDERKELTERIRELELGISEVGIEEQTTAGSNLGIDYTPGPRPDSGKGVSACEEQLGPGEMSMGDSKGGEPPISSPRPAVDQVVLAGGSSSNLTRPVVDATSSLRAEIRRLRSHTQVLEAALRAVREENTAMQDALHQIATSRQRIQAVMERALGA